MVFSRGIPAVSVRRDRARPLYDAAWCDELGAWRYAEAWDMLMFGMRLNPISGCHS